MAYVSTIRRMPVQGLGLNGLTFDGTGLLGTGLFASGLSIGEWGVPEWGALAIGATAAAWAGGLIFGSNAKERRSALRKLDEDFQRKRAAIFSKYPRGRVRA